MSQGPPDAIRIEHEPQPDDRRKRLLSNAFNISMATLYARVMEVVNEHTQLLYCSGPWGMGKTEIAVASCIEYVKKMEQVWEETDDDQKLSALSWLTEPGLTTTDFVFKTPFVRFEQAMTPPKFFQRLKRCSHPGQIGLLDDPNMVRKAENHAMLMAATGGDSNFGRAHMGISDTDANAVFNGALILIDNFNPDDPGSSESFKNRQALEDRAGSARIIMPYNRPVLHEYVELTAFPDPDTGYLGEWEEVGLYKYLFGKANTFPKTQRGLGFTGPDALAIRMVEEVRAWFNQYKLWINRLSYRTVRGLLKDRYLYPNDWENRAKSLLATHELPWE